MDPNKARMMRIEHQQNRAKFYDDSQPRGEDGKWGSGGGGGSRDPYASTGVSVGKVLDAGDRKALLKKSDKELAAIIQRASDSGSLRYAPTQRLLPYIKAWRERS